MARHEHDIWAVEIGPPLPPDYEREQELRRRAEAESRAYWERREAEKASLIRACVEALSNPTPEPLAAEPPAPRSAPRRGVPAWVERMLEEHPCDVGTEVQVITEVINPRGVVMRARWVSNRVHQTAEWMRSPRGC